LIQMTSSNQFGCPNENITALEDQDPFPTPTNGAFIAWLFLNISASQLLLPILVAALFYSKPRAESTLINVLITWIVAGIVSSILLYSGHAVGCEPPPLLCLTQASLYVAIPPMACVAVFCGVLQIFFNVRQKLKQSIEDKDHTVRGVCLLVAPYIIFALFATVTAASGASTFVSTVSRTRRFFYCSVKSAFLVNTVTGFCSIMTLCTFGFAFWIVVLMYQNWTRLHRSVNERLDFSYIFRMLGFHIYLWIALCMAFLPKKALIVEDMSMAITGYVVLFTFGTRNIVLQACLTSFNCFYRHNTGVTDKAIDKMRMVI